MPVDPDSLAADEALAAELRQIAALAGEFYDACKAARLPDDLACQLVSDWHQNWIGADGPDDPE